MCQNLHLLIKKIYERDLAIGKVFKWREITFTFIGQSSGIFEFSVTGRDALQYFLLRICLDTTSLANSEWSILPGFSDIRKGIIRSISEASTFPLLRLFQRGYEGNIEGSPEFFYVYDRKDFRETVYDKKSYDFLVLHHFLRNLDKFKTYNPFDETPKDLVNMAQWLCRILDDPILFSIKDSLESSELVLRIWLFQRGYISLEGVADLWYKVLGNDVSIDEMTHILNTVAFLSFSNVKKHLKELRRKQDGLKRRQEVSYSDSIGDKETPFLETRKTKLKELLKVYEWKGNKPIPRRTFYRYWSIYLKEHPEIKESIGKIKTACFLDGHPNVAKEIYEEIKKKKEETDYRKELIKLRMKLKKCSLNTAQVWVSRNVNALKRMNWGIENIYDYLKKRILQKRS